MGIRDTDTRGGKAAHLVGANLPQAPGRCALLEECNGPTRQHAEYRVE